MVVSTVHLKFYFTGCLRQGQQHDGNQFDYFAHLTPGALALTLALFFLPAILLSHGFLSEASSARLLTKGIDLESEENGAHASLQDALADIHSIGAVGEKD
jgi:hypothetical protein